MGSGGAFAPPEEGAQASHRESSLEARGALTDQRFPRSFRLHGKADFERVQQTGHRRSLRFLDVWWTENQAGHPRMGLIVPKLQSSAVARNRLRRRLRELWRRELVGTVPSWDVVVRARRAAYQAPFGVLRDELLAWRQGAG